MSQVVTDNARGIKSDKNSGNNTRLKKSWRRQQQRSSATFAFGGAQRGPSWPQPDRDGLKLFFGVLRRLIQASVTGDNLILGEHFNAAPSVLLDVFNFSNRGAA